MNLPASLRLGAQLRRPAAASLIVCRRSLHSPAHDASTSPVVATTTTTPPAWHTIYRFPHVSFVVHLNRLKVYQAALTSFAIPACMALETASLLGAGVSQVVAYIGVSGTLALSCASWTVGRNVVGFAYVDDVTNPQRLRLAVPDFWGRRRNIELPVDTIIPQLDLPRRVPYDMYIRVQSRVPPTTTTMTTKPTGENVEAGRATKKPQTFRLAHRHGEIVDSAAFTYVFGEC